MIYTFVCLYVFGSTYLTSTLALRQFLLRHKNVISGRVGGIRITNASQLGVRVEYCYVILSKQKGFKKKSHLGCLTQSSGSSASVSS